MNAVLRYTASDYDAIWRERVERLEWLRAHPGDLRRLKTYYRTHIADMVNDWGVTVDPRNANTDLPVILPFTLDQRQREWIEFTVDHWRRGKYGLTVKSRDVGVSWLIVGTSISICCLFNNVAIGWGSFKREKVDWRGDLGSIFEKGRSYLEELPVEFAAGYDAFTCSFERRLLFPDTAGSIIGEIGDNIGRGGRTTLYFVDETAYLEHDQTVDAALSKNTKCRQDASSVHGMDNTFAQRAHQKSIIENRDRFDFHWRDNPRFTEKDYEEFLELWGPVITAQELDMNFQASVEGIVIPAAWVNASIDAHVKLKLKVSGELLIALDVADQGIDKNAAAVRHGIVLEHAESWSGKESDTFKTAEHAFLMCDTHHARLMLYDADGVGAGIRGDGNQINKQRATKNIPRVEVRAFRGSAEVLDPEKEMVKGRKNKDFFANYKAQSWWWLRMLFQNTYRAVQGREYNPDMIISIDSSIAEKARLLIELSQPTYSQNNAGKLLIDKQPEGKPSPNLADAVMMAYAPRRKGLRIDERILEDEE